MLEDEIIEPMEGSEWISPVVVQNKKTWEIKICVDIRKLNDAFVCHLFPTPFTNEVIDNVGGQATYSFTDGFPGYHQNWIVREYHKKTIFVTEWGYFQCTVMPFGLKNAFAIFSIIVVATFKEIIHKFLEVYLDDGTIFSLLQRHIKMLQLMLDICKQLQISLNLSKCIFYCPFNILFGHIVCK